MQKHKKSKTCKKSKKNKNCTCAPAISTSYLLIYMAGTLSYLTCYFTWSDADGLILKILISQSGRSHAVDREPRGKDWSCPMLPVQQEQ